MWSIAEAFLEKSGTYHLCLPPVCRSTAAYAIGDKSNDRNTGFRAHVRILELRLPRASSILSHSRFPSSPFLNRWNRINVGLPFVRGSWSRSMGSFFCCFASSLSNFFSGRGHCTAQGQILPYCLTEPFAVVPSALLRLLAVTSLFCIEGQFISRDLPATYARTTKADRLLLAGPSSVRVGQLNRRSRQLSGL